MTDYASSAKLAADTAFAGRVQQCLVDQARAKLDAAKTAGIDPSDLVMAQEVALVSSVALNPTTPYVSTAVSLMSSDPTFAAAYANGPAGDQQSGVTDDQIVTAVNANWHPMAVGRT